MIHSITLKLTVTVFLSSLLISCRKENDITPEVETPKDTVAAITMLLKPVTQSVGNSVEGYYVGLPSNYEQTKSTYPVLIYLPGAGQFGNGSIDLPLLLKAGPAQLIDENKFPSTFRAGGQTFSFIVFTPQFRWWPSVSSVKSCIDFVKTQYRVDTSRIYLSGLSMGGILSCDLGAEYARQIAAIVPMAGVSPDFSSTDKSRKIAAGNLPVWAFQSQDDQQFNATTVTDFIASINSFQPAVPAKITLWPNGGHDAWTRAIEPSYRENGKNIYEWMLQYKR